MGQRWEEPPDPRFIYLQEEMLSHKEATSYHMGERTRLARLGRLSLPNGVRMSQTFPEIPTLG